MYFIHGPPVFSILGHWASFPAISGGGMSCGLNEGGGPANCTPGGRVIDDDNARLARHGYMAAVSFADSLLGRVLAQARSMQAWDNTLVLLTSDHGWQLGEHNEWCKTTLFELAVHIPFMIRDPRAPHGHTGERTMAFAENVDIYRTLADLAGLSFAYSLPVHSFHTHRDRVASLTNMPV